LFPQSIRRIILVVAGLWLAVLAGCGPAPIASGINDPNEARNRRIHEFNKNVDQGVLRPVSQAYGTVVPEPVRMMLSNFVSNLDLPRVVVNDLLQGNLQDAAHNTFRFGVNTIFGLGGLVDPASDGGLTVRDSDFGETLHVWGAGEGAYRESPLSGPSTTRDSWGSLVDLVLNPVRYMLPPEENLGLFGGGLLSKLGDRYRYSNTVDSILYDSADSYAQARILYLQNRRFQLGGSEGGEVSDPSGDPANDPYYDPYADPYYDPYSDPYYDPYEDPNAQ